jgi:hypothetical protein
MQNYILVLNFIIFMIKLFFDYKDNTINLST